MQGLYNETFQSKERLEILAWKGKSIFCNINFVDYSLLDIDSIIAYSFC